MRILNSHTYRSLIRINCFFLNILSSKIVKLDKRIKYEKSCIKYSINYTTIKSKKKS